MSEETIVANAKVGFQTSLDAKTWSKTGMTSGNSSYGIQMANFRGELYGIMKGNNNQLYATKYKAGDAGPAGWKPWRALPTSYKAYGRVAVTALEDRFYVAFRGLNNKIYTTWTEDFTTWNNMGQFSGGGLTKLSPAIAGFDGKLYAICTGYGGDIHVAIRQGRNHKVLQAWKSLGQVDSNRTPFSQALVVHHSALYMLYTSNDRKAINTRRMLPGEGWGAIRSFGANCTTGPTAVSFKNNKIVVSYSVANNELARCILSADIKQFNRAKVRNKFTVSTTGVGTYLGKTFVSYAVAPGTKLQSDDSMELDEKTEYSQHVEQIDDDEEEWECKWRDDKPKSKSIFRKLLCM